MVNSGKLYGGLRSAPPPQSTFDPGDSGWRIQAQALNFLEEEIPDLRNRILEVARQRCQVREGTAGGCDCDVHRDVHETLISLRRVLTRFAAFIFETPLNAEGRVRLADDLVGAYKEFSVTFKTTGCRLAWDSSTESLARQLRTEQEKVAAALRDKRIELVAAKPQGD